MDNRLQERRTALGMTQPQVSERLKEVEPRADVGMVSRYERGLCLPTREQLRALEDVYGVPWPELYDLKDLDLIGMYGGLQAETAYEVEIVEAEEKKKVLDHIKYPSHAGKLRKCYRIQREFAASLPPDLLAVCGYSSWQSWYDACMKRLLGEYAAKKKATGKKVKTA